MAKTTIIQITDDLDGSTDAQEVSFSFQGSDYTIDLAKKNLAAFEKALKPYIDRATRVSKGSSRASDRPDPHPPVRQTLPPCASGQRVPGLRSLIAVASRSP